MGIEEELLADLTAELEISDKKFNSALLLPKIKNAIREVKKTRRYPKYYTDKQVNEDLYDYYSNIRNIALYDYNTIGMEFQTASSENSTSRTMVSREKLFAGIIPLSPL